MYNGPGQKKWRRMYIMNAMRHTRNINASTFEVNHSTFNGNQIGNVRILNKVFIQLVFEGIRI